MVEPDIAKRIIDSLEINKEDSIIEVGPGLGSLTHFLSAYDNPIEIVDIDLRMTNFLKVVYQDSNNIKIVENDIRKTNVSKYTKVVGNLPYNITTETIQYFLINAINAKTMVFMIQEALF